MVAQALDVAHADAGDEEAPVGGDVGARGVDGNVAGPAQQGAVLEAEEVARLLLAAPTSGRRIRDVFFFTARKFIYGDSVFNYSES